MEKKDIRVLALDLDGTLTNDQKVVTPATRAALDAAAAKGVTIVLASGRPTAGIMPLAKELGLDKKGGWHGCFQRIHKPLVFRFVLAVLTDIL